MDVCTENGSNGIVAARRIKEADPTVRVVIMTGMPEVTFVEQANRRRRQLCITRTSASANFMAVMRSTASGYQTFPPKNADSIFSGTASLTDVEIQILRLTCEAKTRKEIDGRALHERGNR